jgi:hypothetical protein
MEVARELNRSEPAEQETIEKKITSISICEGLTRQKIGITFILDDRIFVSYQVRKKDVQKLEPDTQNTTLYLFHPTASCLNGVLNFKIEDGQYRIKVHHFGVLKTLEKERFGAISYVTRDDYNNVIKLLKERL